MTIITLLVSFCLVATPVSAGVFHVTGSAGTNVQVKDMGTFTEPWAMTFLPDGKLLVTEKQGNLLLVDTVNGEKTSVEGVPSVSYGGQGGLGDIILHPDFTTNRILYLSYAEQGERANRGAAAAMAELDYSTAAPRLYNLKVIWRQIPKVGGSGHYSHRLAFAPDGKLFITSGERQKQEPAQQWDTNLGKIVRLNFDGSVPDDNPFQDKGELARTFWSLGHRNLLGIAFDAQGRLWTHEMGPRHGDELNLSEGGKNYGWPVVSWGDHYSGFPIPDHDTRTEFKPPEVYWVPTIAPSGLIIYSGSLFPEWKGNALIGGLASKSLIRVDIHSSAPGEVERFAMGKRIREVEQGPLGAIWLLEDRKGGRLLRISPLK